MSLLHKQQVRLGLLKAGRVLFTRQDNLRRILAQSTASPVVGTESGSSGGGGDDAASPMPSLLIQHMMHMATQPSPLKATFTTEELEVRAKSVMWDGSCISCYFYFRVWGCNWFYDLSSLLECIFIMVSIEKKQYQPFHMGRCFLEFLHICWFQCDLPR